jgi:preprotein translocase subunit SecG
MANFFLGLLAVVAVVSSIVLGFVVLLQEPKGGGIAAALGGSGMDTFGPAAGGVNRFTSWMAGIWMVACFLHAILMTSGPIIVGKDPQTAPGESSKDTGGTTPPGGEAPAGTGDEKK